MENTDTTRTTVGLSPAQICSGLTILTAVGAVISLLSHQPLWVLLTLLPVVGYEARRTQEGASTKTSSILLLIILIAEILLVILGIDYDLAKFLGSDAKYIAGERIPLGDIKVVAPVIMAVLSSILVFRTRGVYTRWLSIIIAVGSLTAVFIISPDFFQGVLRLIVNGLLNRLGSQF